MHLGKIYRLEIVLQVEWWFMVFWIHLLMWLYSFGVVGCNLTNFGELWKIFVLKDEVQKLLFWMLTKVLKVPGKSRAGISSSYILQNTVPCKQGVTLTWTAHSQIWMAHQFTRNKSKRGRTKQFFYRKGRFSLGHYPTSSSLKILSSDKEPIC